MRSDSIIPLFWRFGIEGWYPDFIEIQGNKVSDRQNAKSSIVFGASIQ